VTKMPDVEPSVTGQKDAVLYRRIVQSLRQDSTCCVVLLYGQCCAVFRDEIPGVVQSFRRDSSCCVVFRQTL